MPKKPPARSTRAPTTSAGVDPVDVLLVNPPWISKDQNIWHGIKGAMPPLGLLSVAAYAEREGFRVRVIDLHVEQWTITEFRDALQGLAPRYVGISMMTATAIAANRVACCVKEVHPDCVVVAGGVHADAMPTECLKNDAIDIVVRGDGEVTFAQIASGTPWAEIRGISYRVGDRVVQNAAADVITDLDALPAPAYHLVPMHRYYPAIGAYRRLPAINMLMTRGCPGKCTFCNSAETTLRSRSADRVVEEIAHLRRTYGIREIQFYDDTFTIFKSNVLRFCALMKARRLGVSWTAFVRTDCLTERMARAMRDAGCHQVLFGVESGDDEILRRIRKPIDRRKTEWAIRVARRAGLEVRAAFMFGNPGETVASMERTLDYAVKLDPDLAIFNVTTPYPGTQMFVWAKRNGYLNTEDWGEYELSGTIMTLPTVTPEEIADAYRRAYKVFYRRPIVFWRRLCSIRSFGHISDCVHAFCYIILRRKIGRRGFVCREWVDARKEDFWTIPLDEPVLDERSVAAIHVPAPQRTATPGAASHTNRDVPLSILTPA